MFTVKATYKSETRKLSFPECKSLPSFDQLSQQLYRVFPISHTYYLSKVLFSPDASQSPRILLAREVHSADDYNRCIQLHKGRAWPNASLKFTVIDHKIPIGVGRDTRFMPTHNFWTRETARNRDNIASHSVDARQQSHPIPPISVSHIPPPPIIFSSNFMPPQAPMDVDPILPSSNQGVVASPPPQQQQPRHHEAQPRSGSNTCCSVTDAKAEVQTLLTNFQVDLNRLLLSAFGPPSMPPSNPPPARSPAVENPYSTAAPPLVCSKCARKNVGPWYSCENCHIITCAPCHSLTRYPGFCLGSMDNHVMKLRTQPDSSQLFPSMNNTSMMWPPMPPMPPMYPQMPGNLIRLPPWITEPALTQPFNGASTRTPAPVPFIPPSAFTPAMDLSPDVPLLPRVPTPPPALPPRPEGLCAEVPIAQEEVPAPVVHRGIVCDMCDLTIEGVRHKCLDCPDYDLCTSCISKGSAERHNPFHEFFEITEPGRVIVHTVFEGSRETPRANAEPAPPATAAAPAIHLARCDLCDSAIEGDRYKCLGCPDFDTCSSCFSITPEQHPKHSFVKISKPTDFIRQSPVSRAMHYANCDACNSTIYGIRYKCMHPDCPDFDLCANCEALPIPVHPDNHPLLKMKTVETVIPTVYRVGQTQLINKPVSEKEPSVNGPDSPRLSYRTASPSPAFEGGYMHNPSAGMRTRTPSPAPAPPSPFYFPAEQTRLHSPIIPTIMEEQRPLPSPPALPVSMNRWPSPSILPPRLDPIATRQSLFEPGEPTPLFQDSYPLLRTPSPPRPPVPERPRFQYIQPTTTTTMASSMGTHLIDRLSSVREVSSVPDAPPTLPMFDVPGPLTHSAFHTPPDETAARKDGDMSREIASAPWNRQNNDLHHLMEKLFSLRVSTPSGDEVPALPPANNAENLGATSSPLTGQEALLNRPPALPSTPPEMEERRASGLPSVLSSHSLAALLNGYQSTSSSIIESSLPSKSPFDDEAEEQVVPTSNDNDKSAVPAKSPFDDPEPEAEIAPAAKLWLSFTSDKEPVVISPLSTNPEPEFVKTRQEFVSELPKHKAPAPIVAPAPLSAVFVADITVRDGQIFPPGAEFVKCWRMVNDGERAWPEGTELVFMAGKPLSVDGTAPQAVKVGAVESGKEMDVYTGELKAPDAPGSYIGYWRLRDEQGKLFGDSIWIDISVAEVSNHSESSDESLASSAIIMPHAAQSTSGSPTKQQASTVVTVRSNTEDEDTFEGSENGSDSSSVSLISMPSSASSDEDNVLWEDSRSHFTPVERPAGTPPAAQSQAAVDYVLLYDDTPSSEEE